MEKVPCVIDAVRAAAGNENFRAVQWTGAKTQVVVMSLRPFEVIDREIHPDIDQLFFVVSGMILADTIEQKMIATVGQIVMIPMGTSHEITAGTAGAKLITTYSPPNHPPDRIQAYKPQK